MYDLTFNFYAYPPFKENQKFISTLFKGELPFTLQGESQFKCTSLRVRLLIFLSIYVTDQIQTLTRTFILQMMSKITYFVTNYILIELSDFNYFHLTCSVCDKNCPKVLPNFNTNYCIESKPLPMNMG